VDGHNDKIKVATKIAINRLYIISFPVVKKITYFWAEPWQPIFRQRPTQKAHGSEKIIIESKK